MEKIYVFYNAGNVCLHRKELHKETVWHLSSKNCCVTFRMLVLLFKECHVKFLYIFKSPFPVACTKTTWENQRIRMLMLTVADAVYIAQEIMFGHALALLCFPEMWSTGLGDKQKGLWAPHSKQRFPWFPFV